VVVESRADWMSSMASGLGHKEGYCLHLANGQGWRILLNDGVNSWVAKLASIMELGACDRNGYPRLVFIWRDSGKESWRDTIYHLNTIISEDLPVSGWKARNLVWLKVWYHSDVPDVICEIGPQDEGEQDVLRMRLSLQPIYQRAQDSGGLPLHAALVEWNATGILLAASANTGKSTCCHRLRNPWKTLCDDETLVIMDNQQQYLAHPFPTWSDYLVKGFNRTWNVQHHVPISAIFFLEQARVDEVLPMGQGQAALLAYQSAIQVCHRNLMNLNREQMRIHRRKLFENACDLTKLIPAFKLKVSLVGQFWKEMERVLS